MSKGFMSKGFIKMVVLSIILALFVTTNSAYASEAKAEVFTNEESVVNAEGKFLGTKYTEIKYDRKIVNSAVEVTMTQNISYQLINGLDESYKSDFKDSTRTTVIKVTKDNEYYINNEKLSAETLSTPVTNIGDVARAGDAGGIPAICHYYSDYTYTNYAFGCYYSMTWNAGPDGSNVQKTGVISNNRVVTSISAVDAFETDYNSYKNNIQDLMVYLGIAVLTLETVLGAIAAGAAAAYTATKVFNGYYDCNDRLHTAYNRIYAI